MKAWFRRFAWRVVGILASLESHPEKEREYVRRNGLSIRLTRIGWAVHFLKLSAIHFRESFQCFRLGLKYSAYSARNCAKSLYPRVRIHLFRVRKSPTQSLHFEKRSCPPSDTQNELLSNDKNTVKDESENI